MNDYITQLKDKILEKDYVREMKREEFEQEKLDFVQVPKPVLERFKLMVVVLERQGITLDLDEVIMDLIGDLNKRVAQQHDIDLEHEYQRLKHPEKIVRALPPEPDDFDWNHI